MEKTAVITGAANGLGLALARQCAAQAMNVILVDLPGERLASAEQELSDRGGRVHAYAADVSDANALNELAAEVHGRFDTVDLLFNNAGIAGLHRWSWTFSDTEWDSIIAVNLRGVINGVSAFLPKMIERNEGHVINTSSMGGLIPTPMNGAYVATKYAIVGYSETLALDLASFGSGVGVSVVCPGLVRTELGTALMETKIAELDEAEKAMNRAVAQGLAGGMDAQEAAEIILDGVRANRFYILTHPEALPLVEARFRSVRDGNQPSFQV